MKKSMLRVVQVSLVFLVSVLCAAAADNTSSLTAPVAKKVPNMTEIHGRKLVDNYYWLRDKPNPEVKAYLLHGAAASLAGACNPAGSTIGYSASKSVL